MTLQEIYDKVKAHLIAQGRPAMEDDTCCYRTASGLKCAVGCLIPDDRYQPGFEGEAIGAMFSEPVNSISALMVELYGPKCLTLLRDLQTLHDEWPFFGERQGLHRLLEEVALCSNLQP